MANELIMSSGHRPLPKFLNLDLYDAILVKLDPTCISSFRSEFVFSLAVIHSSTQCAYSRLSIFQDYIPPLPLDYRVYGQKQSNIHRLNDSNSSIIFSLIMQLSTYASCLKKKVIFAD